MTIFEHAQIIKTRIEAVEAQHGVSLSILRLHNALGEMVAAHGAAVGLTSTQLEALGGGTPKTPPQQQV